VEYVRLDVSSYNDDFTLYSLIRCTSKKLDVNIDFAVPVHVRLELVKICSYMASTCDRSLCLYRY